MSLVGLLLLGVFPGAQSVQPSHRLQPPHFFYEPQNAGMLRAVRESMEKGITFNRHFSQSYVSCGLACGT